jgi:hypothetical protein
MRAALPGLGTVCDEYRFGVLLPCERSSTAEAVTIRSGHIDFMATADLGADPWVTMLLPGAGARDKVAPGG